MPHFSVPSSNPSGNYDIRSGAVWRLRINEGQRGRIAIRDGARLEIASNNGQVVPNDDAVFVLVEQVGNNAVLELFGLSAGTSMIEARDASGSVVAYVQVQVASIGGKHAFFKLNQPSMALHSPDTPVKYDMKYVKTVPFNVSPADALDFAVQKSHLAHLVFSCHGSGDGNPYLVLGTGFRDEDAAAFGALRSVVSGVIWIAACALCMSSSGVDFCSRIARASQCYVVAPGITIPPMKAGHSQIEVFTRSMPHYFDRDGKLIGQSDFMRLDHELGFKLIRVQ
jgi:hypothetical protein